MTLWQGGCHCWLIHVVGLRAVVGSVAVGNGVKHQYYCPDDYSMPYMNQLKEDALMVMI